MLPALIIDRTGWHGVRDSLASKLAVGAAVLAVVTGCPAPTTPDITGPDYSTAPAVLSVAEIVPGGGAVSSSSITITWTELSDPR